MKSIINIVIVLAVFCTAALTSCTKTTGDAYKKYTESGELVYPGRPDTVNVRSGYKRVQLAIALGNDPLVTKLKIFWNSAMDSLEVPVTKTAGQDTVDVIIPNLQAGNYDFTVYTYDSANHKSVPSNGSGTVYGDSYLTSLTNRSIKSVTQSADGTKITLSWGEAAAGELGTKINYFGADGVSHELVISPSESTTVLPDYQEESKLTVSSLYKPDATAFEFFSPSASEITLPAFERELSKSGFQLVILPTDVLDGGYGWLQQYLWDNNYNPPGFATQSRIPCWFTIDVGQSAALSRFKVWQANDRLYNLESVKTFELYGSNNPASDGSWDSWTKIGSYESVKPSGQPVGQNTQGDIDYAKAGEVFMAPAGTAKFRYYRFKLLTNWGNGSFMTMEEVAFYTHDKN